MLLKIYIFEIWASLWNTPQKTLGRFSKDSCKTLRRLLEDSPRSLPKSFAQGGTKEWCQVESKLIYVEEWYLAPSVIVLFMICFMICMYYFICEFFCKLEDMLIKRIWYICSCVSQSTWHYSSYWYNIPRIFKQFYPLITKHNNTIT